MARIQVALVCLAALAFKNAESLRCWSCSSDVVPCADYFNTTQYLNNRFSTGYRNTLPVLTTCEEQQSSYLVNQRPVCMKKKMITGRDERVNYIRSCQFIARDTPIGTCPTETTTSNVKIDFCEYCDYDGCNGANAIGSKTIFASIVSVAVALFFRY